MKIAELYIYPVKSMAGIRLKEAKALNAGFEFDRRWMLLDANNQFLTQRQIPDLALFKTSIEGQFLIMTFKEDSYHISLDEHTNESINTTVWSDHTKTVAVSLKADEWLSDMLQNNIKMVRIHDDKSRMHHNKIHDKHIFVSLADGYPYLITGTASLALLNSKLEVPITMDRFRPNIVVETKVPHEEDEWTICKTKTVEFLNMKPSGRCQVITIDQKTAQIDNSPLKVLNHYRKRQNNVLFGCNYMCLQEGIIAEGDQLFF